MHFTLRKFVPPAAVRSRRAVCTAMAMVLGLAGCDTVPMNTALTEIAPAGDVDELSIGGYRQTTLDPAGTDESLLILMASSGGGKRSAAFSYGVLQGLRDFHITVNEVRPSAGAGFLVVLTGDIMTMPGLPKRPAAEAMGIDPDGTVHGLF